MARVKAWRCDALGCDAVSFEEAPPGYVGKVMVNKPELQIETGMVSFYACSFDHVADAIETVTELELEQIRE